MKKETRNALIYLIIVISLAYLPFLNFRVLRMAGDEKVYVSQAIEMAREGRWFVQTLADQPDYYKGPLHYILIRVGLILFGTNLLAVTWMNWFFALLGGIAFYFLGAQWKNPKTGFLLGILSALNIGVFSHAFASQMEVELTGLYAIATAMLGLPLLCPEAPTRKNNLKSDYLIDLPFWITAGIAGLSKSPLHAFLIGMGAVCFWFLEGSLWRRLKSVGSWLSAITGIIVCLAGYAPAYIFDHKNFMEIFIGRENVQKPDNGRHVDYVLRSIPHFLFPWTGFALVGFFKGAWKLTRNRKNTNMLIKLGIGMCVPTFLFFCAFPYKGQNYNMVALSPLLLAGLAFYDGVIPQWSQRLASITVGIAALLLTILFSHFFHAEIPSWWPSGLILAPVLCFVISALQFWRAKDFRQVGRSTLFLFVGFASLIIAPGEREMLGIKEFIKIHPEKKLVYYNLEPTIWSEWGLLQCVLGKEVRGLHRENQMNELLASGNALIVPGDEALKKLEEHAKNQKIDLGPFQVASWKRWMTKGTNSKGETLWKQAWQLKDLSILERDFYILWR